MGPLLGVTALFVTILIVVKLGLDHRTRNRLIEKGMVDENIRYLYQENGATRALSSLKWALVLIGLGGGIIVGQIVPSSMMEEITAASMFLLAGIGLIVYYFIAAKALRKDKD